MTDRSFIAISLSQMGIQSMILLYRLQKKGEMPIKESIEQDTNYPIKAYSKKQLCEMYSNISFKTLDTWLKNAGLDVGSARILTPKQVQ